MDSELHEAGACVNKSLNIVDSNNDDYPISENEQSTASTTSSASDMPSSHSPSAEQLDDDASDSDKQPSRKRRKTNLENEFMEFSAPRTSHAKHSLSGVMMLERACPSQYQKVVDFAALGGKQSKTSIALSD